jgi:hypothetical protein
MLDINRIIMAQNLKDNERELIKLVNFFRKEAETLMREDKSVDYNEVINSCEKLIIQLNTHSAYREEILSQRESLKNLIKDNAVCPKCSKNNQLKHVGVEKNEQGWKSNKYKCRKCNIEFVLNRPNNPWDMIPFIEKVIADLEQKFAGAEMNEKEKGSSEAAMIQMKESISKLKPVVEASDLDYKEMVERELQMDKMIHEFRNHLMIERIKMDTWERRQNKKQEQ